MPDGDIIKIKLTGYYRKSYKMICEGRRDDLECASATLNALKKQIQKSGDITIDLAKELSFKLYQNLHLVSNQTHELKRILNQDLRESRISPNINGLLTNATNSLVHDLKYGKVSPLSNLPNEIIMRYISETYKSSFTGRINATTEHYLDTSLEKIKKTLSQIEPQINKTISKWSSKLCAGETVKKLRLLPIKREKINLDENLL